MTRLLAVARALLAALAITAIGWQSMLHVGASYNTLNFFSHYIMPVAIVLDWLLQPPGSRLKAKHLALALVFPAAYLVYVLLRGAVMGWYPYPFLNPANVSYSGVAMYSAGIFATFLLVGGTLLAAGNRFRSASGVEQ